MTYRAHCEGRKTQRAMRQRRAILFGGSATSMAHMVERLGGEYATIDRSITVTEREGRIVWGPPNKFDPTSGST